MLGKPCSCDFKVRTVTWLTDTGFTPTSSIVTIPAVCPRGDGMHLEYRHPSKSFASDQRLKRDDRTLIIAYGYSISPSERTSLMAKVIVSQAVVPGAVTAKEVGL